MCRKGLEVQVQKSTVTWGLPNLIEYCRLRRNWALYSYLIQQNSSSPPGIVHVHPQCRTSFVDPKRLKALDEQLQTPSPKKQKLRSANDEFQWKVNCFLCGIDVLFDHKFSGGVLNVTTPGLNRYSFVSIWLLRRLYIASLVILASVQIKI